jgi:hypothetical protein
MRPARVAGGVVKLGSAIGEVCCACAGGAVPIGSAAKATIANNRFVEIAKAGLR